MKFNSNLTIIVNSIYSLHHGH